MPKQRDRRRKGRGRSEPEPHGRLERLLADAHGWLRENRFPGPARCVGRMRLAVMIVGDYLSGRYRRIPVVTIWMLIFAIAYIVGPFDLIPDVIPGLGWLDDAFVVGLVFRAFARDLHRYCEDTGIDPRAFGLPE